MVPGVTQLFGKRGHGYLCLVGALMGEAES